MSAATTAGTLPARIYLVGFMGSGKSTVAPLLAGLLGYGWIDVDAEVEAGSGLSVREIFARDGEAGFRRLEREALLATAARTGVVVAPGGGAVASEEAWAFVRSAGVSVWLRADMQTTLARVLGRSDRPMLAGSAGRPGAGGEEEVRAAAERLLRAREPFYRRSDIVVDVDPADPAVTAALVAGALRARAVSPA